MKPGIDIDKDSYEIWEEVQRLIVLCEEEKEEIIEETEDINRLRRRFQNNYPNCHFLKCGHYCRTWEETDVCRYFKVPPYLMEPERPGERMMY